MSNQIVRLSRSTLYAKSTIPEEKLIQPNDPVLDFIPNLKDLRCDQIDSHLIKVQTAFFNAIHGVGKATSDLETAALSDLNTVPLSNPNNTTFMTNNLSTTALSDPNSAAYLVNEPSGTKIFDVSTYLETKHIDKLLAEETPENCEILKAAILRGFMAITALLVAKESHYLHHNTPIETCNHPVNFFKSLVCKTRVAQAQNIFNIINSWNELKNIDTDLDHFAHDVLAAGQTTSVTRDKEAACAWERKKRFMKHQQQKDAAIVQNRSELIRTFLALLNVQAAIDQLAIFALCPQTQDTEFYQVMEGFINDQKQKKADEATASLLKEVEEDKQKTSRKKRPPPKKSTKSLKQALPSLPSQSSSVVEKQPLLDQAARPKEKAQTSPELDMLAKIHQGVKKTLSLHDRIKRWSKVTPETIHQIKDWSEETKQWIYPYTMDPDPESTIARHNLSFLLSILRSDIGPFYATSCSFKDADNYLRSGKALVADMERNGIEESGTIFVGIGTDDVLYHAYFTPFDQPSPKGIANGLRNQLKQMAHIDKAIVETPRDAKNTWKMPGKLSVKREPQEGKLLLVMEHKNIKFTFYPLTS